MKAKITLLPGDGIGAEVVGEAARVLEAVAKKHGHDFEMTEAPMGGAAIEKTGVPLPPETLESCKSSDAVLLGAVGAPKWDDPKLKVRPEQGLLQLRKGLGLFANIRPVQGYPALIGSSTLRPEVVGGVDLVIVRELTGGIYFGEPKGRRDEEGYRTALDTMIYHDWEIERLVRVGFEMALKRRKKLTSVDKANVLSSSRLWREVAHEVAKDYPDVEYEDVLVDACAMHLIRRPDRFDVIATANMFGDILSDEASMLTGSLGMLPSASLGEAKEKGRIFGLYEPIHGSAPDIAGQGIANPLATILSAAMLLRTSLGLDAEAKAVERAVEKCLEAGLRTPDLAAPGEKAVGTREMTDFVVKHV